MTLKIQLSAEAEAQLNEQASATGREAAAIAAQIVETTLAQSAARRGEYEVSEEEQKRLHEVADRLLAVATTVVPGPNPPWLKGRKAEFEQAIFEKHRKRGSAS